jgi:hypothetical protein
MLQSNCTRCGAVVEFDDERAGELLKCPTCQRAFLAPDIEDCKPVEGGRVGTVTAPGGREYARSAMLVGGLLLAVAAVVVVLILALRPSKPAEPSAAKKEPDAKATEEAKKDQARAAERVEAVAKEAIGTAFVGIIAAWFLYQVVFLLSVGWVMRDAGARGMNGLAWGVFALVAAVSLRFFFFSTLAVMQVVGALAKYSELYSYVGLAILMSIELTTWSGVLYYFYTRRPGKLSRCAHCPNRRLSYLLTCPHCGRAG